ncbi:MAG: thymidylate synthase [Desulfobaccales bacterium]
MEFEALYFKDRLKVINRQGTIGVVTLWSKVDYVVERFRQAGVDLDPATSPIAVFGNLYGNGLREMLRNLLYNPQIQTLLICGHDRSGSREELQKFFELGLEPVESSLVCYQSAKLGITVAPARIRQTKRIIDDLVRPEMVQHPPNLIWVGDLFVRGIGEVVRPAATASAKGYHFHPGTSAGDVSKDIHVEENTGVKTAEVNLPFSNDSSISPQKEIISDISASPQEDVLLADLKAFFRSWQPPDVTEYPRIKVPLPEVEVQYFPSNPRGHVVVRDTILKAWKEVLYLVTRFGHRVKLKKGDRLELQNVKVVVETPEYPSEKELKAVNLDYDRLLSYFEDIFRGVLNPDETYNYGHRLRSYFKLNTLAACAARLRDDPEDRKSYVALWDTSKDLTAKGGRPCLVSLFFRKFEGKLTLSATFRTHNAMDAYPMNLYGLHAIQGQMAKEAGLAPGAIVVISHSLALDPKELDRALLIIGKRPFKVNLDPMGYFRVTLDGKEILVEHRFEDVTLKEYRGKTAVSLQHQIARDVAVSDINHAIYLGRQLAKAEMALKDGREFVQD